MAEDLVIHPGEPHSIVDGKVVFMQASYPPRISHALEAHITASEALGEQMTGGILQEFAARHGAGGDIQRIIDQAEKYGAEVLINPEFASSTNIKALKKFLKEHFPQEYSKWLHASAEDALARLAIVEAEAAALANMGKAGLAKSLNVTEEVAEAAIAAHLSEVTRQLKRWEELHTLTLPIPEPAVPRASAAASEHAPPPTPEAPKPAPVPDAGKLPDAAPAATPPEPPKPAPATEPGFWAKMFPTVKEKKIGGALKEHLFSKAAWKEATGRTAFRTAGVTAGVLLVGHGALSSQHEGEDGRPEERSTALRVTEAAGGAALAVLSALAGGKGR